MTQKPGIIGLANNKIGAVQVNMVDYKPFRTPETPLDPAEVEQSRKAVRALLDSLRTNTNFIPRGKDKTIAEIDLASHEIETKLRLTLQFGQLDDPYPKPFALPVPSQFRDKNYSSLHEALKAISRVDPGGNVPNMVRNLAHAIECGVAPEGQTIDLYTTSDPEFERWFDEQSSKVHERIHKTLLSVPARKGLHLQYARDDGATGTMGIGTRMHSTLTDMERHVRRLAGNNHNLVSESLYELTRGKPELGQYQEFQNPSTAFRQQCGFQNYSHTFMEGKQIPTISMNTDEMVEYVRSVEIRRDAPNSSNEPVDVNDSSLLFAAPLDKSRTLHPTTITMVNESFNRYFVAVSPKPQNTIHFPVNVSCGEFGGYNIACLPKGQDRIVVYSSVPHSKDGAAKILDMVGPNPDIDIRKQQTMGAGDSVATVLSLAHVWDVMEMLKQEAKPQHPLEDRFYEIASAIFVSLLSRVAGEVLYHSDCCDWSSVPAEAFHTIIHTTMQKSLDQATMFWRNIGAPMQTRENDWDVDIAMWKL